MVLGGAAVAEGVETSGAVELVVAAVAEVVVVSVALWVPGSVTGTISIVSGNLLSMLEEEEDMICGVMTS